MTNTAQTPTKRDHTVARRKYEQLHAVRRKVAKREHKRTHKESYNAGRQRRAARLAELPDTLTSAQWESALVYWRYKCAYCSLPTSKLGLDHYVPIYDAECPGHTAQNCLPYCPNCNRSKQQQDAAVWLEKRYGREIARIIPARIQDYFTQIPNTDSNEE